MKNIDMENTYYFFCYFNNARFIKCYSESFANLMVKRGVWDKVEKIG